MSFLRNSKIIVTSNYGVLRVLCILLAQSTLRFTQEKIDHLDLFITERINNNDEKILVDSINQNLRSLGLNYELRFIAKE